MNKVSERIQNRKTALIRDIVIFEAIAKCLRHRPK